MLFILEPKQIEPLKNQDLLGGGWNYVLDYSWLAKNILDYNQKVYSVWDIGCGKRSRLAKYIEGIVNVDVLRIDRRRDILNALHVSDFLEYNPIEKPDIIYWASSIEHNTLEQMNKLYKHSMYLLKEGGMFLATIAISEETFWQDMTKQTNLSVEDAVDTFDITNLYGHFGVSKEQYRENCHGLKDKYTKRFGKFDKEDPLYIVGGVKKIKR